QRRAQHFVERALLQASPSRLGAVGGAGALAVHSCADLRLLEVCEAGEPSSLALSPLGHVRRGAQLRDRAPERTARLSCAPMRELFATGHVSDLILRVMLGEAIFLGVYHRRTGRGMAPLVLMMALVPGACLLLALRNALTAAPWTSIALWLVAALVTH